MNSALHIKGLIDGCKSIPEVVHRLERVKDVINRTRRLHYHKERMDPNVWTNIINSFGDNVFLSAENYLSLGQADIRIEPISADNYTFKVLKMKESFADINDLIFTLNATIDACCDLYLAAWEIADPIDNGCGILFPCGGYLNDNEVGDLLDDEQYPMQVDGQ